MHMTMHANLHALLHMVLGMTSCIIWQWRAWWLGGMEAERATRCKATSSTPLTL
jgi:hypothetical protein